ncbi:MAG: DUF4328 domain-containing protein [Porticoccaceae bacterium]|nr:DUF4328 domain-containing protein [Porticoccaceae bacterium]
MLQSIVICPKCGGREYASRSEPHTVNTNRNHNIKIKKNDPRQNISSPATQLPLIYKSLYRIALLSSICNWMLVFSLIGSAAGNFFLLNLFPTSADGWSDNLLVKIEFSQNIITFFENSTIVLMLVAFFSNSIWIYTSAKTIQMHSSEQLKSSPGWSVGWFFIPIAQLWKPYQAVKSISDISFKLAGNAEDAISKLIFPAWWIFYLLTILVDRLYLKTFAASAGSIENLMLTMKVSLISSVIFIIATILFNQIMRDIHLKQMKVVWI